MGIRSIIPDRDTPEKDEPLFPNSARHGVETGLQWLRVREAMKCRPTVSKEGHLKGAYPAPSYPLRVGSIGRSLLYEFVFHEGCRGVDIPRARVEHSRAGPALPADAESAFL